jgi:3-oxoacyl-[acyl-carrier protein] reductase
VADEIRSAGASVDTHELDALDERAVDEHAEAVVATELGPHGIRVVTLRTGGIPETIPSGFAGRDAIVEAIERATLLGRAATLEDVGNVAAFAASDLARTITGNVIDISCGTFLS